jgi:ketosteroid isomerase-like protein
MPQDREDTVRQAIAALNARDVEGYLACCTEDVEVLMPMAGAQYARAGGITQFFTDIEDIAPDLHLDPHHVETLGETHAIAYIRFRSTGRASGIVSESESTAVYDFVGAKIGRIRLFLDRDEALKAVGMAE